MREHFLLDPEVVYLNHGVYGACPRPVFERYQAWQLELEREPAEFISRRLPELLAHARAELAAYIGAQADDVTFVQNATTGVNMAAQSLDLKPGDEVLSTDLEYGACDYTWAHVCERAGAHYVRAEIPLPLEGDVVEQLFARRTARTRVVYVSHITSETGLLLPVEEIVSRAKAEGLVTIVDGAHAVAQVDLDLDRLDADFYSGNCHKWMCAPKGAGFLHVRPERQDRVRRPDRELGPRQTRRRSSRARSGRVRATRRPTRPCPTRSRSFESTTTAIGASRSPAKRARPLCELLGTEPLSPTTVDPPARGRAPACADPGSRSSSSTTTAIEIPTMGPRRDDLLRISIATYTSGTSRAPARRPRATRLELPAALRDVQADERAEGSTVLQGAGGRLHRAPPPGSPRRHRCTTCVRKLQKRGLCGVLPVLPPGVMR